MINSHELLVASVTFAQELWNFILLNSNALMLVLAVLKSFGVKSPVTVQKITYKGRRGFFLSLKA